MSYERTDHRPDIFATEMNDGSTAVVQVRRESRILTKFICATVRLELLLFIQSMVIAMIAA